MFIKKTKFNPFYITVEGFISGKLIIWAKIDDIIKFLTLLAFVILAFISGDLK
jgi:hypothetical protein